MQSYTPFMEMLESSIGSVLPDDIKIKINEVLIQHFGDEEDMIDDKPKKLLIDVLLLLSNASKTRLDDSPKAIHHTTKNCEDENSESNKKDLPISVGELSNEILADSDPIFPKNKIQSRVIEMRDPIQTDQKFEDGDNSTSITIQKNTETDVARIMQKLRREGQTITTPPTCIKKEDTNSCKDIEHVPVKKRKSRLLGFNDTSAFLSDEDIPKFKIWDSDDDNFGENVNVNNKERIIQKQPTDLTQNVEVNPEIVVLTSENEDKIEMVTLDYSQTQLDFNYDDQCKENVAPRNTKESPDVLILGERKFSQKCIDLSSKTDIMYNRMNPIRENASKKLKLSSHSPERVLLCNVKNLENNTCSQKTYHNLRSNLHPARYSTDPYTPERCSFPVSQYEKQIYNAVCNLASSQFQDYEH
ncbi:uncharacterized protein LOC102703060 isoform X1 [Oryza brachyantha]|uniref:uncharacterized protein LOC102703060 isoform X1 n=2 Tax=Oryza brachyantha TaxID=4533 RepID=UPI001ADCF1B7|nr:uncharacterized protein LOC102703060 isoform X1 [Oryza brachyantha]XP_040383543.1 uncharacterized protein LOC102703060 isoform X1 [Oryza brachyantha]XP_040383544.1 uncharacterized protein LOC102703060 isoform X1 [Oryza brachyantha]